MGKASGLSPTQEASYEGTSEYHREATMVAQSAKRPSGGQRRTAMQSVVTPGCCRCRGDVLYRRRVQQRQFLTNVIVKLKIVVLLASLKCIRFQKCWEVNISVFAIKDTQMMS